MLKKYVVFILGAVLALTNIAQANTDTTTLNSNQSREQTMQTITMVVGNQSATITLTQNSSAQALYQRLQQGNITITVDDYGDMEKVGALGFSLPRNDTPTNTNPGDIILYQGNQLVFYYDHNSWNFTPMGKVNNISSRQDMLKLLDGVGQKTITLSLP